MLVASRWWLAMRAVMAAELRKWFTLFTLREDSRAPTSLRSPKRGGFLRNPHSLPTASCAKLFHRLRSSELGLSR